MNRHRSIRTERRPKQDELVKGGLTPILQKRNSSPEIAPGEARRYASGRNNVNTGTSRDSTSRPLMTQPVVRMPKWDVTPGLLGIYNHGNTCFMNTILQCLSNTDLVSEYFVLKKYKELINHKGIAKRLVANSKADVAESLGGLLESLWSGEYTPEVSSHFKSVVSKHNTQYKGSSQHDAQEFLSWLLQRLNEELYHNLHSTKKKGKDVSKSKRDKQTELPTDSSPETVMAAHQGFEVYNRFQALYRSSLTCPNCGENSNTYEPYAFLSLPVPHRTLRPVYITVVYLDDNPKQLKIALEMNIISTIKDLREKLAYELEVPPKRLVLCQIFDDGFRNTYGDEQHLSDIHEGEAVYVFETYPFSEINKTQNSFETIQILLVHIEKVSSTKSYRFCTPQVIRVQRDCDYIALQRVILKSMGLAVSEDVVEESKSYDRAIFKIRVIDSGVSDVYLPFDVEMPLYTQAIDRALSTYSESDAFGPSHVKFVIEWDPSMKTRIVEDDEDTFEEHQSVHKERLSHQQPSYVSLDDCLTLFTQDEKLGKEELWNCPHCEKVQPCKKLGLVSLPDILVVHLKRFGHCGVRRNKLNILVNFPVNNLDMGHHVLQKDGSGVKERSQGQGCLSDLYDLYAVSNHYGNMNGGHYTAFCRNPVDNQWYEFDDTTVKPLKHGDIVSRAAYLLFYQRKQVTNNTRDKLLSNSHWVFDVYGPPPAVCDRPDVDDVDAYIDRIKIHQDYDSDRPRHYRAKSEPYDRRVDNSSNEDYLRREMNSPKRDDGPSQINSPRQRQDDLLKESQRKELYVNMDQAPSVKKSKDLSGRNSDRVTVVEQILKSKLRLSPDTGDGSRTVVRDSEHSSGYRQTDSVDSGKNTHSYSSSGDTSHGSLPPSPVDDHGARNVRTSNQNTVNSAKSVNRDPGYLLNNERDQNGPVSGLSNGVKLKYSNQINGESPRQKKEVHKHESASQNVKVSNTKIPNSISNVTNNDDIPPPIPARRDIFSTPQQGRRSPSGPATNGRGPWSTPQPQRKQYNNDVYRPPMDRQSSVPITRSRPQSSYDSRGLEVEGHSLFDNQPRSMPVDVHTMSSKPPLPKSSQTMSRIGTSRASNGPHESQFGDRPLTNSRVPAVDIRPFSAGNQGRDHMRSDQVESRYSNTPSRVDYRERNLPTERHDIHRRSMHVKAERPQSYHQSTYNDTYDQYYLSQPVNDYGISHANRYATIRAGRHPYVDEDDQYFARQEADQQYTSDLNHIHEPRSRAPVSYNPQRYQDLPRYQPHLQTAKMMTRIAMQEREHHQKMKSHYLKESSV